MDGASGMLDSTYDEYMFVFTDIGPATDDAYSLQFQVNATDDAGGGYDTCVITSTLFSCVSHDEADATSALLAYDGDFDQAQTVIFRYILVLEVDRKWIRRKSALEYCIYLVQQAQLM